MNQRLPAIDVQIQRLPNGEGLALPAPATPDSAGADLLAANGDDIVLQPGARIRVPCGFAMALPPGYEAQIRPRSGLAFKWGITVLNTPGTVDADYRGEVSVLLINHGEAAFTIRRGDRIAQMVIQQLIPYAFSEVPQLQETKRGAGGYGSTGYQAAE